MKKFAFSILLFVLNLICINSLVAQTPQEELNQLFIDDSTDIGTIAVYPKNTRDYVFKVSSHPEGITRLNDAQKKSNTAFRNLLSTYPKEDQQKIWNLTRYDNLIPLLSATSGRKKNIENVLTQFPTEIHDDALNFSLNHFETISAINNSNKEFAKEFEQIISNYAPDHQFAYREILKTPELFNLLSENLHMTIHLGSIYKNDPLLITQQFDSLSLVVAEENTKEKEAWKKEMLENPEAEQEIKKSSEEYAKENGYSERDYNDTDPLVVERYVYLPYPYWCGYPWWYQPNYWYPYPYWHHFGYYHSRGHIVWIGAPSRHFIRWHFQHNHHFYHYPHITNIYINHYYYGPRISTSGNRVEVHQWMNRNENSFPRDFRTNNNQRIDRIREYGKVEIDRDKYNNANPGRNISHDDYIKQHVEEYPHLKQTPAESTSPANNTPGNDKSRKPATEVPAKDQPSNTPAPARKEEPNPNTEPRPNRQPKPAPTPPRSEEPQKPTPAPRKDEQPSPAPRKNEERKPTPTPRKNDQPKQTPAPRTNEQPKQTPAPRRNDPQPKSTPAPAQQEQPQTKPKASPKEQPKI